MASDDSEEWCPIYKWGNSKEIVYVTVFVPCLKQDQVTVTLSRLGVDFRAERVAEFAGGKTAVRSYRLSLKLRAAIDEAKSVSATIDGRRLYVIRGHRGTVNYLGIGTQAGQYGQPGGLSTVAYAEASDLDVGKDGTFELYIGPPDAKPDGCGRNFLPTDPTVENGSGLVIVRQTFNDRKTEVPAEVAIELADGDTSSVLDDLPVFVPEDDPGDAVEGLTSTQSVNELDTGLFALAEDREVPDGVFHDVLGEEGGVCATEEERNTEAVLQYGGGLAG